MHSVSIRPEIIERVMARRGRTQWFDTLDPAKTAIVVIDMQPVFCAPGGAAEVPESREIVAPINKLNTQLRKLGCAVIWVVQSNIIKDGKSDWKLFYDHVVGKDVKEKTIETVMSSENQNVWSELQVEETDHIVAKNRYSAIISGSSRLERLLRSLGVDTILIAGTKTNVCCESTARDAMMLDFQVVMLSDCCAALSDDEHRSALENIFQQFGDVSSSDEVLRKLAVKKE